MTMTINSPIRPGAALNDPETYRFVEEKILDAKYDVVTRNSYIPDRAYNKEGIVNILANYPWHEYGYKSGRWKRVAVIPELDFIPWREWGQVYETVLLVDPATGLDIAEVNGIIRRVEPPSGRLLFAGDPHYAGVISSVVKGERHIHIVGSTRLAYPTDGIAISAKARDLTKIMVPGDAPQVQLFNPPTDYLKLLGPWLVDHPQKPPKPGKGG
jgi:hypothetical protein